MTLTLRERGLTNWKKGLEVLPLLLIIVRPRPPLGTVELAISDPKLIE